MGPLATPLSLLTALAVLTPMLAGCATPSPEADPGVTGPPSSTGPTRTASPSPGPNGTSPEGEATAPASNLEEIPWELLGCRFAYAQPAADAAAVSAMLPEGFTLAQPIGPRILVGFEVNQCASGSGLDGPVAPQTYASFWVPVAPPSGLGDPDAAHFVNFDVLVQDAPRRALLTSWGTPAHDGSVAWSAPTEGALDVTYTLDGVGRFAIHAAGAGPRMGGAGTFDQWTPGTSGLTYWKTEFAATRLFQGPGLLEVDPASPYAAWFESPAVPALVSFGDWNYTAGLVRRPAA